MKQLPPNFKKFRKNSQPPEGYMQAAEYAAMIDVSKARISQAAKKEQGFSCLQKGREVWVNVAEANLFFKYVPAQPARRVIAPHAARMKEKFKKEDLGKGKPVAIDPFAVPPEMNLPDMSSIPSIGEGEFSLSQRQAYEKARGMKRDNDKADGLLVEKQPMRERWYQVARTTRDAMEAIPARIAPKLVGKNAHEIEQMLVSDIKKALTTLIEDITC